METTTPTPEEDPMAATRDPEFIAAARTCVICLDQLALDLLRAGREQTSPVAQGQYFDLATDAKITSQRGLHLVGRDDHRRRPQADDPLATLQTLCPVLLERTSNGAHHRVVEFVSSTAGLVREVGRLGHPD